LASREDGSMHVIAIRVVRLLPTKQRIRLILPKTAFKMVLMYASRKLLFKPIMNTGPGTEVADLLLQTELPLLTFSKFYPEPSMEFSTCLPRSLIVASMFRNCPMGPH